jgi:hypothetical protein
MRIIMEKEKRILEEVDKTLKAYDDMPTLTPNPFLFGRIKARLAQQTTSPAARVLHAVNLKPIVLAIVILLNILTDIYVLSDKKVSHTDQLVHSLSVDYNYVQDSN